MPAVGAAYSNLEIDLATKERGSRYSHVEALLRRLTGAEDALVVNNNAAAVLLALETLARGKEVIVSRGELIEIGGEFRIPDIMRAQRRACCARWARPTARTCATTPRRSAPNTGAPAEGPHLQLPRGRLHRGRVSSRELAELGRERGIPVMEDLGSGSLVDLRPWGFPYEPTVPEVVASGVDLVTFSGDKLLGGPQAGIVVGQRAIVGAPQEEPVEPGPPHRQVHHRRARGHALRLRGGDGAARRCRRWRAHRAAGRRSARARRVLRGLRAGDGRASGGARRRGPLAGGRRRAAHGGAAHGRARRSAPADAAARALDAALRAGDPPVIGRLVDDRLFLDCRTVLPEQVPALVRR